MDYQQLVNTTHPYCREASVSLIEVDNLYGEKIQIEEQTYQAFLRLKKRLHEKQIEIGLIDAYRTVKRQQEIWEEYQNKFGLSYTKQYVAQPGTSEHHTGLAIDFGLLVQGKIYEELSGIETRKSELKEIFSLLKEEGFILRYPKGKEKVTGYQYEPWHIRYLASQKLATFLEKEKLTLEEYKVMRQKKDS